MSVCLHFLFIWVILTDLSNRPLTCFADFVPPYDIYLFTVL